MSECTFPPGLMVRPARFPHETRDTCRRGPTSSLTSACLPLGASSEQEDGIVQLSMQSAVGYHCVWYRTQYFAVRIDVFPAGE
jgi:hypothetical protein